MSTEELAAELATAEKDFEAATDFGKVGDTAGARSAFERFLESHDGSNGKGNLHPRHHLLLNAHASLINCCFRLNDLAIAAKHSRIVAEGMSSVMDVWPETADFWFRCGEMEEIASRAVLEGVVQECGATLETAMEAYEKCWKIRRIIYGDDYLKTLKVKEEVDRLASETA
ncbi:hypothetical protein HK097_008945 [Rhizophlyctis rosea]|uniref:Uncharacterized protein n=1 Tax=Rhizophlyctis rosea TaxID=64517 RepID=A0AAD5S9L1_9FUNG|nr:hypothetical protein HK097_008945 [Rhizophlyctis rosea]